MSRKENTALLEIGFVIFVSAISLAVFRASLDLPVSLREPLGSATLPQIICAIILLFCMVLLVRSLRTLQFERRRRLSTIKTEGIVDDRSATKSRNFRALAVFMLAVIYVVLIQTRQIPTAILTPALLFMSFLFLNNFRRSSIFPSMTIALVTGLSVSYIFREFFLVNLP